jgi:hypothetical protein
MQLFGTIPLSFLAVLERFIFGKALSPMAPAMRQKRRCRGWQKANHPSFPPVFMPAALVLPAVWPCESAFLPMLGAIASQKAARQNSGKPHLEHVASAGIWQALQTARAKQARFSQQWRAADFAFSAAAECGKTG